MAKQYGGWYDNPDTGKNQRWFDGAWTDGSEPGGSSSSGSSSEYYDAYDEIYSRLKGDVESYSKELLSVVGEDYDFAVKWIEENYKEALGTNDAEKAKFMREVANKVEAKVGRIQFDYNTGKYRAEADKTTALARLKEDESVLRNRYAQEDTLAREQQNASLNSRGLMDNNREEVSGLGGRDISRLEQQMSDRMTSLDRSIARDTQDINLGFTRGNEDLTTAARRAALDSEQQRSYGLESSELAKKRQEAEIKRQKSAALRSLPGLAQSEALQRLGYS